MNESKSESTQPNRQWDLTEVEALRLDNVTLRIRALQADYQRLEDDKNQQLIAIAAERGADAKRCQVDLAKRLLVEVSPE